MKRLSTLALALALLPAAFARQPDVVPPVRFDTTAIDGTKITIPSADAISILAFVRPDQEQSASALSQIRQALSDSATKHRVIVIVSGERDAKQLGVDTTGWTIATDPDFAASGAFNVHVWPTTTIVTTDGRQAGHLAGLSGSFKADFIDHLAFASGKIDQVELKRRLSDQHFVADNPKQRADRNVTVATRMLDAGHADQAAALVAAATKLQPDDPELQVLQCRVLLAQKKPADALELVNKLPTASVPAWQLSVLRGRALIDLNRWDEAATALADATKLNPRPGEAHYLKGKVHAHAAAWQQAAAEFQSAYESRSAVETAR